LRIVQTVDQVQRAGARGASTHANGTVELRLGRRRISGVFLVANGDPVKAWILDGLENERIDYIAHYTKDIASASFCQYIQNRFGYATCHIYPLWIARASWI
jgi:hypothetical protein